MVSKRPIRLGDAATADAVLPDDPAHGRIMTEALSIFDILVSRNPPERGLPQQTRKRMAAVLAVAGIGKRLPGNHRQAESVVAFAIGEQSGVGCDPATIELKLYPAVETGPERVLNRFTRWVLHNESHTLAGIAHRLPADL